MIKNYLKIALKVLVRRKFFTFVSLFGTSFTLMVLLILAAAIDSALSPKAPEVNLNRTLHFTQAIMSNNDPEDGSQWWSEPGYKLIDKYLRDIPGVEITAIYSGLEPIVGYRDGEKIESGLRLVDAAYWEALTFEFLEGGPFVAEDNEQGNMVAIINESTCRAYFDNSNALNQHIYSGGQRYRIIGVVKDVSAFRESCSGDIFAPIQTTIYKNRLNDLMGYFNVLLVAESRAAFSDIKAEFQTRLRSIEFPDPDEWNSLVGTLHTRFESLYTNLSGLDTEGELRLTNEIPKMIGCLIAFLFLPVVNLVSINMSRIFERSSEIGVRKAFGASSAHLVGQFVMENIVLCIIGGLIGVMGALFVTELFSRGDIIPGVSLVLNYRALLHMVLISALFGALSGAYPAWHMSRLHPVDALRGGTK